MTSTEWYRQNPAGRRKKQRYNQDYQKQPSAVKKRVESNAARRRARRRGKNIKGLDYDHRTNSFIPASENRGAPEKSRLKGSKRS